MKQNTYLAINNTVTWLPTAFKVLFMWIHIIEIINLCCQTVTENTSKTQAYLGADARCGHTEGQDGDILGSVQPVYCQFRTCGPLHHSHIVFPVIYTRNKQQCLLPERLYPITRPWPNLSKVFIEFKCPSFTAIQNSLPFIGYFGLFDDTFS